ncbi:hypothetical protein [Streptomyces sp. NPDC102437]|uniref:hypothetical protein n=1 Tax=Streptomyces sp. NPDC102437 TaxID=3366175 RepID=UPI00381421D2
MTDAGTRNAPGTGVVAQRRAHRLGVHADRFPALTRALAEGAFAPTEDDPLSFGLTCVPDGAQGPVESAARA